MFELFGDIVSEPDYSDYEQIANLIRLESASLASNFNSFGYSMNHSQCALSKPVSSYPAFGNAKFLTKFASNFLKAKGPNLQFTKEEIKESLSY